MEHLSMNAFKLGTLLFLCLYLSNLLYSLIGALYKIKILEFSIFFNPWFSIHKKTVKGINFILGWLPFGGYVKLLGMTEDEEEQKLISQSDLPYAFFTKPKYLKSIFKAVPYFIFLFSFIVAFLIFNEFSNISNALTSLLNYIKIGFFEVISTKATNNDFSVLTNEFRRSKNIVLFSFMIMTFIFFLLSPITNILNWFSNSENKKSTFQKIFGFAITILLMWFYFWKLPKFIFSFFTLKQDLFYFLSFLLGMFFSGLFFYFITLLFSKYILQNPKQT